MKRRAIAVLFLAVVTSSALLARERERLRVWTDDSGKFTRTATFLDVDGGRVLLRKSDGRRTSVPLNRLSKTDQAYVRNALAKAPKIITGKVVGVTDGDTLTVLDSEKQQHKIRLNGIDSPEIGQGFGTGAKTRLTEETFNRQIRVEWREKDKYGRTLGDVYVGDHWVNNELVREGLAWHYREYSKDRELADSERVARKEHRGLWAVRESIPPWEFRHGVRPTVSIRPSAKPEIRRATRGGSDSVFVTRTGKKYHRAGCRYLSKSKIPISLAEATRHYGDCSVCKPPR